MRDVWVVERSRRGCFLFEAPHSVLIRGNLARQYFQRDLAIQARVVREIDFTHTSCADKRTDFVASELCLRRQTHLRMSGAIGPVGPIGPIRAALHSRRTHPSLSATPFRGGSEANARSDSSVVSHRRCLADGSSLPLRSISAPLQMQG